MYNVDFVFHAQVLKDTAGYARDTPEFLWRFINRKEDDDRVTGGETHAVFAGAAELWAEVRGLGERDGDTDRKGKLRVSKKRVFTTDGTEIAASSRKTGTNRLPGVPSSIYSRVNDA